MAFKMLPNPINKKPKMSADAVEPNPQESEDQDPVEADTGDISEATDDSLSYIKDFLSGLNDTEFAYLQDCIAAKMNAEDKPTYKSPEKVKDAMDAEGSKRSKSTNRNSATFNDNDGDEGY